MTDGRTIEDFDPGETVLAATQKLLVMFGRAYSCSRRRSGSS
jgi:hypothetical protein